MSRNTISLLFNGKLRLSVENAMKLEKLVGADAATLLRMQTAYDILEVSHSDDDFDWIEPDQKNWRAEDSHSAEASRRLLAPGLQPGNHC